MNENEMTLSASVLQAMLDRIPVGIQVLSAIRENERIVDFEYILINKEAKKYSGTGLTGKKFLNHNGNGHSFKELAEVVETGTPLQLILPIEINNTVHHFNTWSVKFGDGIMLSYENNTRQKGSEHGDGNIIDHNRSEFAAATKDITEQKIKEDAHFISQVIDISPDIIYIMDLNTNQVIYANREIASDLGYSKQQIAAMKDPIFDIMFEEDIPLMTEHLKKMKMIPGDDKVLDIEYRLKNALGGLGWFSDRSAVFKRNNGKIPVEKIGIIQNITARKEQEEQKFIGLDILHQAEEIAAMGSWEYDILTGDFKWSEGMYKLFNLPRNIKVTPEIYLDHTPGEDSPVISRIVSNITNEYRAFEETITLLPLRQEKKIVKIKAVAIKNKKNQPVKMIGVDLDITSQVKTSEEIAELNKMLLARNDDLQTLNSELKTFNIVTSHDYKETIQTLYTNLEYIVSKEGRNLSDTSRANIRRAQVAIQRMKLLTDDINGYLQLYEIGVNKTLVSLNDILRDALSRMKGKIEQAGATIESADLPQLYADPFLLSRLLACLIDNAIKFRKVIVPLLIKIKYSQADEINAVPEAVKDTPYTIISVSDNGIGFNEEQSDKIFELFFRLHDKSIYKGSGIGLAICKKIMAMHGGFITAEGRPANGATFNCYFPLKA
jgi:PAS domain S-box-containing protein